MNKKYWIIGLVGVLILAACGGSEVEPTPGLVLPTAVVQEAATALSEAVATITLPPESAITPVNTPTLAVVDTPEVGPTATALPPTLIPSDVIMETARPFISQDLLFIGDGELRKWSRRDGSVMALLHPFVSGRQEAVVGEVNRFVINADGTRAVAARMIPTEPVNSELWWVDTVSGEERLLVERVTGLIHLALSPDGRSLIYVASDANTLYESGPVYRLNIDDGAGPTVIGSCSAEPETVANPTLKGACMGVDWTPDSQNMLWSDAKGIWLRHLNANQPTLILPVQVNEAATSMSLYQLESWSLNSRYLLLTVFQDEEVHTAVLDVATNTRIDVPGGTVGPDTGYVDIDWMQDGRLFVFRERNEQGTLAPTLQLWRLNEAEITREESTALQLPPHEWLQDGVHFITGRFAFTLLANDPTVSGIYLMASSNEQPERVNGLPFLTGNTTWLYDNVGTLLSLPGRDNAFVFLGVEPGEGVVYEVRPFLGERATNFIWVPQ